MAGFCAAGRANRMGDFSLHVAGASRSFPIHRFALIFGIIETLPHSRKEPYWKFSPRLRWKLDRFHEKMSGLFGQGARKTPRPKLCPACGTLVGATATKCHQCGASLTFGMAAASRSLSGLIPTTSPATYGILTLSCLLYGVSLLATIRTGAFKRPEAADSVR